MKATLEKIEDNRAHLEVEVGEADVDSAIEKAFRKVAKKVSVPGFRKGKAPRTILERYVGKGPILEEALDLLVPAAYSQAVRETGIEPIDHPQIQIVQLEEGKPLTFKANVEVKPEVRLPELEELVVEKPSGRLDDEYVAKKVEEEIQLRRERRAELRTLEGRRLEEGLWALIDFQGYVDGKELPNSAAEGYLVEIGGGKLVPGFETQLVGAGAGDERDVEISFPEDFEHQDLAGKTVVYRVRVREVKEKVLPPLDDQFVKDASPWQTVQELRSELANKLKEAAADDANRKFRNAAVDALTEKSQVEVPEVLVERRLNQIIEEHRQQFKGYGIDYDKYLREKGEDPDEERRRLRPRAELEAKKDLVIEAVVRHLEVKVEDQEVIEEIEKTAAGYGQSAEHVKKFMMLEENLEKARYSLAASKAIDLLCQKVKTIPSDEGGGREEKEEETVPPAGTLLEASKTGETNETTETSGGDEE